MGCDIHLYVEKKTKGKWQHIAGNFYDSRNYETFAILADVRNGNGIKPISPPKGLPIDVSKAVRQESDNWGRDGHSHSYLTMQELSGFDWKQVVYIGGIVDEQDYHLFKKTGHPPQSWCQGVSGPNIEVVTPEEMEKPNTNGKDRFCRIRWPMVYNDEVDSGFVEMLEELKEMGKPDEVRIVFWFDN